MSAIWSRRFSRSKALGFLYSSTFRSKAPCIISLDKMANCTLVARFPLPDDLPGLVNVARLAANPHGEQGKLLPAVLRALGQASDGERRRKHTRSYQNPCDLHLKPQ